MLHALLHASETHAAQPTTVASPPLSTPPRHELQNLPISAAQLAVQTYWTAEARIWQLREQASRTIDPEEENALLDLVLAEHQCLATARYVLATVWGITVGYRDP